MLTHGHSVVKQSSNYLKRGMQTITFCREMQITVFKIDNFLIDIFCRRVPRLEAAGSNCYLSHMITYSPYHLRFPILSKFQFYQS